MLLPAALLAQRPRANQGSLDRVGRVRTTHSPCPYPCDDCVLGTIGGLDLGVHVPEPTLPFGTEPLAILSHVFCDPLSSGPSGDLASRRRAHRCSSGKPRGNLHQCTIDHDCDRIEVRSVGLKSQPLRLKRNRPPARKRVQDRRHPAPVTLTNRLARLGKQRGVTRGLPDAQFFEQSMEACPFRRLCLRGWEHIRIGGRIVNELSEQDCTRVYVRATSPPMMKRCGFGLTYLRLTLSLSVDDLKRQRRLDELLLGCRVH